MAARPGHLGTKMVPKLNPGTLRISFVLRGYCRATLPVAAFAKGLALRPFSSVFCSGRPSGRFLLVPPSCRPLLCGGRAGRPTLLAPEARHNSCSGRSSTKNLLFRESELLSSDIAVPLSPSSRSCKRCGPLFRSRHFPPPKTLRTAALTASLVESAISTELSSVSMLRIATATKSVSSEPHELQTRSSALVRRLSDKLSSIALLLPKPARSGHIIMSLGVRAFPVCG